MYGFQLVSLNDAVEKLRASVDSLQDLLYVLSSNSSECRIACFAYDKARICLEQLELMLLRQNVNLSQGGDSLE